ncbi:hypothetical protein FRC12_012705 [Ceratobasidium sp. 428]|nr:hypothetical protein FRC12_012705 [Ceratobasidium sp. 428]
MEINGEGEGARDEAANATISGTMPALAIIEILVSRRCRDITEQLDLGKCGLHPFTSGGFGDIFQGTLIGGEKVAIKCMKIYLQRDDDSGRTALKRAARELDNWSHFEHKNILKLSGLAQFRDQMAMISPWMDQGTLLQYLKHNPDVDRCQLCIDISEGVAYLHQNDAPNVVISGEGVAKLTDFGCTMLKRSTLHFTTTPGGRYASMRWAAPERLNDEECSKEADVYALGMTLLETVTGAVPFSDIKSDAAVCTAVVVRRQMPGRPKEFPSFNPDEANQLWAIVVDSCAHDSSDRPGSTTIRDRLQGIRKHSRKPSPNDMITGSISNTTEHGQPQTLSVPSDEIDEGYDGYVKHSGDNDYSKRKDVDEEEKKLQANTTSAGRSEAALTGASLNSTSDHSVSLFVIYVYEAVRSAIHRLTVSPPGGVSS